jgi:hypothetical protein
MWEPRRLTTLWASTARYRDSFTGKTESFSYNVTVVETDGPFTDKQKYNLALEAQANEPVK